MLNLHIKFPKIRQKICQNDNNFYQTIEKSREKSKKIKKNVKKRLRNNKKYDIIKIGIYKNYLENAKDSM